MRKGQEGQFLFGNLRERFSELGVARSSNCFLLETLPQGSFSPLDIDLSKPNFLPVCIELGPSNVRCLLPFPLLLRDLQAFSFCRLQQPVCLFLLASDAFQPRSSFFGSFLSLESLGLSFGDRTFDL